MPKKKQEVFFTGLSSDRLPNDESVCCYLCQRANDSKSYYITDKQPYEKELEMKTVRFENPYKKYQYLLCDECVLLLSAITCIPSRALRGATIPHRGHRPDTCLGRQGSPTVTPSIAR